MLSMVWYIRVPFVTLSLQVYCNFLGGRGFTPRQLTSIHSFHADLWIAQDRVKTGYTLGLRLRTVKYRESRLSLRGDLPVPYKVTHWKRWLVEDLTVWPIHCNGPLVSIHIETHELGETSTYIDDPTRSAFDVNLGT